MTSLKASRRVFKSEGDILKSSGSADNEVLKSKSESYLSTRKSHPLLNFDDDFSKSHYGDIILAAETLENIVNEGSFIGYRAVAKSAGCREMSNNVLKLVYGTMKCY